MSNSQSLEVMINGEVYYKAEKAQEVLGMTYSALRNQVIAGNVKKDFPPGSRQGYYRKKDVDDLANKRRISEFFGLENEEEMAKLEALEDTKNTHLLLAKEADIPACIALNRELFDIQSVTNDVSLQQKWGSWIRKNPDIVTVLKCNDDIIGILTLLPFKAKSKKIEEVLMGDTSILLGDVNILPEDLEEYKKGNAVLLYIAEIGVKQSLNRSLRSKYGLKLINSFVEKMIDLAKKKVNIEKVVAVGETKKGVKLLQHFGFSEVLFPRADTRVFVLDLKESGAPIARMYRDAFAKNEVS